ALPPASTRASLAVASATGTVPRRFTARPALRVPGVGCAPAMTRRAAARLPGAVVRGDSRRLPVRDAAVDAVVSVWLLHLLSGPEDRKSTRLNSSHVKTSYAVFCL